MRWVFDDDIAGDSDSDVSYPKLTLQRLGFFEHV